MQKIKIMTDSACDISYESEKELGIDVLSFQIAIDGKDYLERQTITPHEFYELLSNCDDMPVTSQITTFRYVEQYKKIYDQGYKEIINITISSTGSNTYNSAKMAVDTFFDENPGAVGKFKIHVIDSKTYSGGYGYVVDEAAKKAKRGVSSDEIIAFLEDWFSCVEIYFAPYTLNQVKRSGRVSCAAAFMGELLGIRPLIKFEYGVAIIEEKIRGNNKIVPRIAELASKNMIPQTPYIIMVGSVKEHADDLASEMTRKVGYPPSGYYQVGSAVANNCGPEVAAIAYKANKQANN